MICKLAECIVKEWLKNSNSRMILYYLTKNLNSKKLRWNSENLQPLCCIWEHGVCKGTVGSQHRSELVHGTAWTNATDWALLLCTPKANKVRWQCIYNKKFSLHYVHGLKGTGQEVKSYVRSKHFWIHLWQYWRRHPSVQCTGVTPQHTATNLISVCPPECFT